MPALASKPVAARVQGARILTYPYMRFGASGRARRGDGTAGAGGSMRGLERGLEGGA